MRGWHVDPFGIHEFRFFSDDGKPTLLVRDGETKSYDKPPSSSESFMAAKATAEPQLQRIVTVRAVGTPPGPPSPPPEYVALNGHAPPQQPASFSHPHGFPVLSRAAKVAYGVVLTAMVVSAVALAVIHLNGKKAPPHPKTVAQAPITSATTSTPVSTTTLAVPSALKPTAADAAADLVSSWAAGNQAQALSVATAPAVATLFASHYTSGLAIDRGCSVAFSPIVCSYGPPGGSAPTDPIYEIDVLQATGGWYVSAVKINN
jgi:hypothetical protein